jgi:hypothetical protein
MASVSKGRFWVSPSSVVLIGFRLRKGKWSVEDSLELCHFAVDVKQEKFGGLRLAGVPERQSKAFDFFVSREPFLVSAFAFEQFKPLVKQRLIRFERQSRLETAAIPRPVVKLNVAQNSEQYVPLKRISVDLLMASRV